MPGKPNRFQQSSSIPLRATEFSSEFTDEQLAVLGIFLVSLVYAGSGVYANSVHSGSVIRLRIYADNQQYEDNLSPRDDFAYILGDYAKQFNTEANYRRLLAATWGRRAESAQEARSGASEGEDTGKGGAKPLRGSQGR